MEVDSELPESAVAESHNSNVVRDVSVVVRSGSNMDELPNVCDNCHHILHDVKAKADHKYAGCAATDLELLSVCDTHPETLAPTLSPTSGRETHSMEVTLHKAICGKGTCDLLQLDWHEIWVSTIWKYPTQ
jgi:hypothetical protein